MSCFYGVALPLVKAGIPLQPVQLEYAVQEGYLDRFRVLLLTYDGQKPPSSDVHDALARWVRNGGNLLYVGNGADPFHDVPEWWNDFGKNPAKACDDLFAKLGVIVSTEMDYRRVGRGSVGLVPERPIDLATDPSGADRLLAALDRMPVMKNRSYERRNSLVARRGPFIAAAAMDETPDERPLKIEGPLIELFDPEQPVVSSKVVLPGEQSLVYDLRWAARQGIKAKVLTASSRIRLERSDKQQFSFAAHGPENYPATAVVMLPAEPETVAATPRQPLHWTWDSVNRLLRIHYVNTAQPVQFEIKWN